MFLSDALATLLREPLAPCEGEQLDKAAGEVGTALVNHRLHCTPRGAFGSCRVCDTAQEAIANLATLADLVLTEPLDVKAI